MHAHARIRTREWTLNPMQLYWRKRRQYREDIERQEKVEGEGIREDGSEKVK